LHEVLRIAAELRDHAGVRRNWLGVSVQEMTSALREILGVAPGTGVIVIDVDAHGPATKAGLELGDVILSCDLKVVRDAGELMASVATAPSNARLRLQVFRNGETLELPVVLSELPARQETPPELEDVGAPREDRIRAIEEEIARLKASLPHNNR
jgi:S1-C subfamily serine protease